VSSSVSNLLASHANCLPVGTKISDFEIIGLIGEGGFGIVYLARDISLDRVVAIKEFMPAAFAGRIDGIRVAVRAANHRATFDAGLKSFINEAKMLAKFAHPALLEVFRFWEGNGTAYMAMRLYKGETLRQYISTGTKKFNEDEIAQIMGPIFDALEMLHREQVFHRDIAPDNIMLANGRSVLLDFGSARKIIGDATQALTTVLKPGYAPIEQYSDDGTMKQGPWTDVYALGGVLYHLAVGKSPIQAVSRMLSDPMLTVNEVAGDTFSTRFSDAVTTAMRVRIEDRFQTVTSFREALGWNVAVQPRIVTVPMSHKAAIGNDAVQTQLTDQLVVAPPITANSAIQEINAIDTQRDGGMSSFTAGEAAYPNRVTGRKSRSPLIAIGLCAIVFVIAVGTWLMRDDLLRSSAKTVADNAALPQPTVLSPAPAALEVKPAAPAESAVASPVESFSEGELKLDIKPWGTIAVDGVSRGISPPLKQLTLSVGKHTIEVANPPAAPVSREIEITKDASVTLSHTFK
jgi:serine/threonine protein kinase